LPETETELDNLTEFNTAHNRRISMLGIPDEENRSINRKRKKRGVSFNEEEEIINPEDIDPSVGKFRNLVQTTVIPAKKRRMEANQMDPNLNMSTKHHYAGLHYHNLYDDLPTTTVSGDQAHVNMSLLFPSSLSGKLGLSLPNPAPEVDMMTSPVEIVPMVTPVNMENVTTEPKKKKYAKEAWPGKKPVPSLLV